MRFRVASSKPDMIVGERFVPGSDSGHFCKPSDVAVLSTGEFFVSDGYVGIIIIIITIIMPRTMFIVLSS